LYRIKIFPDSGGNRKNPVSLAFPNGSLPFSRVALAFSPGFLPFSRGYFAFSHTSLSFSRELHSISPTEEPFLQKNINSPFIYRDFSRFSSQKMLIIINLGFKCKNKFFNDNRKNINFFIKVFNKGFAIIYSIMMPVI
jgi:hypothetical protein